MDEPIPEQPAAPKKTLLNARRVREEQIIDVDLGGGEFIRARKCDFSTMLFEGMIATPIMMAAQKFIENREQSPADRMDDLDEGERQAMLEVMRHHAVNVSIEPVIVIHEDGNDDHLPVELLTFPQLLAIWNQTAVTPRVGAAEAATFRRHQRPITESLLRPGKVVRPTTTPVVATVFERKGA